MNMPFNQRQFLEVFRNYNEAIWPVQVLAMGLGLMVVAMALSKKGARAYLVLPIFAVMWTANGLVYHFTFFAAINPIAKVFGIIFIVQALLFAVVAFRYKGRFDGLVGARSITGLLLAIYALVFYPCLGLWLGHGFPFSPMFGVAPCPTTIFTLGVMLMAHPALPKWLFAIPMTWALIGTSAALGLGILEDIGLGVALLVVSGFMIAPYVKKLGHHTRTAGNQPVRGH